MSKENFEKLFNEMEKDLNLKKKYTELTQEYNQTTEKIFFDMLIKFGKNSGFEFSEEDLIAARAEYIDKANSNKELSNGALENVSGGKFPHHWASAPNSSQVFFLFRCI